jgi:hypothetical protein
MAIDHKLWKASSEERQAAVGIYHADPLTYKAFMTEFRQGIKAGAELADKTVNEADPVGVHGYISEVDGTVTLAAEDLMVLAKRIHQAAAAGHGSFGINEKLFMPKLSGILSALIYNAGKLRGLKQGDQE